MPHNEELLAAPLSTWGTVRLARGTAVPWEEFETDTRTDFTGKSAHGSKVRFPDAEGRRDTTPREWLEGLAGEGATRTGLLLPEPPPERTIAGKPVAAHHVHAFAGTGGAALASDVFGGMGSWNDLCPDDRDGDHAASSALFDELLPSLVAAANAIPNRGG